MVPDRSMSMAWKSASLRISGASVLAIAFGFCVCGIADAGVDVWTPIGPENAQLVHVAIDPSASTRLYATVASGYFYQGGLYRSDDSGASWTPITPPQPSFRYCDPSPPAVQSDGAIYVSSCERFYKSRDAGISWSQWTQYSQLVENPVGDPTNPMVLYALSASEGVDGTLFKTTNGGMNWSAIDSNLPVKLITQLVVDATLPTRLYAISQDSVFKSLDGGASWNPIDSGLPDATFNALALAGSTLFVGTEGFGVYKSVDNGTTWAPANNGISTGAIKIVRVANGSTLYAAAGDGDTVPFFKSTDGGASWRLTGTLSTPINDLTVSRQSDSILYAATLRGLAQSNDGGASWTFNPNNGLTNVRVERLYVDAVSSSVLYAGGESRDYKSVDRGSDWSPLALPDGSPVLPMSVSSSHSGTVYGMGCDPLECAIYRSTNFGFDWTPILDLDHAYPNFLSEVPNAPGSLLAIETRYYIHGITDLYVLRSDDGGVNWSNVSTAGLPANIFVGAGAMDPSNPNALYISTAYGIYKTSGGGIWVNASGGLPASPVDALAINPAHPTTIFAGVGFCPIVPALCGLYRSDDGGTTWGARNPAFVNLAVTALAVDLKNPSNVYAGTYGGGVYRSTDGGTTFRPINNGLTNVDSLSVLAIAVDPTDGRNLYIGTNGGAFALTLDRYDTFVSVIEFYNYDLDHYFMASELQADVPALDSGAFPGWIRTGQTFKAYPQPAGAAQPVCRFYIPPEKGDSHFYSASTSECAAVLDASIDPSNPAYLYYSGFERETAASFYVDVPANGSCPPGQAPVYRLWNKRLDSNHRYTTDPAIRDAMIAKGYVLEGAVMCALL